MKRLCVILLFIIMLLPIFSARAQDKTIEELQKKISELQQEENTLAKQISLLDSQISLTSLRINTIRSAVTKLTAEIGELADEIERLEGLLTRRTELVLRRIPESYKRKNTSQFGMFLLSSSFSEFIALVKYISTIQEHDAALLFQLKATQNNFAERKNLREGKKLEQEKLKKQLEQESASLTRQKKDKQILLTQTKNSETVYQQLLAQAEAEQQAIKGIIAGGGVEVRVGVIKAGDRIASIISGQSCNSSGTHVHFIVEKNGATENPFTYLKNISYDNCSGYKCGDNEGDPFNPSGNWDWPINGPIKFNQGYGNTWATKHIPWLSYKFHNGIDISGSSLTVKSIQQGMLYRGIYSGYNGCRLPYVKVEHDNSELKSYYLHVNY
mgnify:FL=1